MATVRQIIRKVRTNAWTAEKGIEETQRLIDFQKGEAQNLKIQIGGLEASIKKLEAAQDVLERQIKALKKTAAISEHKFKNINRLSKL